MRIMSNLRFWVLLGAAANSPAWAETQETPDCYDAIVVAKILRQTPSVFPDSKGDFIVMVWPWFLKLEVSRTLSGHIPIGPIIVQSLQHSSFREDLGAQRWWLRRNSLGGFNLLRFAESEGLSKCSEDGQLAEPYIRPGPGQTIDSLLSDGERAYGAHP